MAYGLTTAYVGAQPIANTETVQKHPLGTIVRAVDPTYGEGEFIYLLGVNSTAVGSLVAYDSTGYQTKLAPVGTNLPEPIAVAMSANVGSQYGWYQISGRAIAKKTSGLALGANAAVGIKTAGLVAATGTGKEIQGALTIGASTTATSVSLIINRPHMQGRIT
jgi:hypothetical protein